MKVIAINGSPHKEGNTFQALKAVGNVLIANGIEFELIHVGNKAVRGCLACGGCARNHNETCSISSDDVNGWIQQLKEADGILLGSPVYYAGIAGTMKSFLDRAFCVAGNNGGLFRNKVGASVTVMRRSGGSSTFDSLNHYLTFAEMIPATSNYWTIAHGASQGEVLQDEEGLQIMEILGRKMVWLLQMRDQTKATLPEPAPVQKIKTNFIR